SRARGPLAWLGWLGLHLVTLLGGRNRISALVNLSWRYLTWSRGGGVIIGDDEAARRLQTITAATTLPATRQRPSLARYTNPLFAADRRRGGARRTQEKQPTWPPRMISRTA